VAAVETKRSGALTYTADTRTMGLPVTPPMMDVDPPLILLPLIAGRFYCLYQSAIAALVIPMHADKCATTTRLILENTGLKIPHFLREVQALPPSKIRQRKLEYDGL
jgi:hypothetical protein